MRPERVFHLSNAKIMAGGRAITRAFSEKIEAEGFASTALMAVGLARMLAGVEEEGKS